MSPRESTLIFSWADDILMQYPQTGQKNHSESIGSPRASVYTGKPDWSIELALKYNHTTFWALYVLGQQILSQICSLIVLRYLAEGGQTGL